MAERSQIAKLRITPSWGVLPLPIKTWRLVRKGDEYWIEAREQTGRSRKSWRVVVSSMEVHQWHERLRETTIPALPVSPSVCDGEYVELTVHGECADLTLGWWTCAPAGTEGVAGFAEWLCKKARSPEEDGDAEDK